MCYNFSLRDYLFSGGRTHPCMLHRWVVPVMISIVVGGADLAGTKGLRGFDKRSSKNTSRTAEEQRLKKVRDNAAWID